MKKLLISASLLWAVALTTVAQDNFKLIGKIDGADSDTLCIELPGDWYLTLLDFSVFSA